MTPQFDHLVIEVVALAGALADAGEHRHAAMRLGDVVDQLHDDHGLADAGAAEQADLAALGVGRQQVDDLDAGDQDLALRSTGRRTRAPRDGSAGSACVPTGPRSSTGSPITLMMRPSVSGPTGMVIGRRYRPPSRRAPGRRSCPWRWCGPSFSPRCCATSSTSVRPSVLDVQRVQDRRQVAVEVHVDDRAHDLGDRADVVGRHAKFPFLESPRRLRRRR